MGVLSKLVTSNRDLNKIREQIKLGKLSCKYLEEEHPKINNTCKGPPQERTRRLVWLEQDSGGKRGWRDARADISDRECRESEFYVKLWSY